MYFDRHTLSKDPAAKVSGAPLAAAHRGPEPESQAGTPPMKPFTPALMRLRLMGAGLDPITPAQVLAFADQRIKRGRKAIVANHNLHSLCLAARNPGMSAFFERADVVQIDSIPLIAWGRLLGQPVTRAHRSTYLDWRHDFWALASKRRWRVFLLGAGPGVADRMAAKLEGRWPGIEFAVQHGYFDSRPDSAANTAVVQAINDFRPDVVMVGMGMPIQEAWIAQNVDRIDTGVFFSVGGAFDYEAGVQVAAPRWLGMLGLEWMFRFALQPRRLFHRYFVEPWSLFGVAAQDLRLAWRSRRVARVAV